MAKLFVIYGNQSSGKSTLAKALSKHFSAPHHSSDGIREELTGNLGGFSRGFTPDGKPFDVFFTLRERVERDMKNYDTVIADSTGQSPQYRQMVKEWRTMYPLFVVRLYCDPNAFAQRELMRTDRWELKNGEKVPFKMPDAAYQNSSKISLDAPPQLDIETTYLTPEEVFQRVMASLA